MIVAWPGPGVPLPLLASAATAVVSTPSTTRPMRQASVAASA
jgi:hypothetical protein